MGWVGAWEGTGGSTKGAGAITGRGAGKETGGAVLNV